MGSADQKLCQFSVSTEGHPARDVAPGRAKGASGPRVSTPQKPPHAGRGPLERSYDTGHEGPGVLDDAARSPASKG